MILTKTKTIVMVMMAIATVGVTASSMSSGIPAYAQSNGGGQCPSSVANNVGQCQSGSVCSLGQSCPGCYSGSPGGTCTSGQSCPSGSGATCQAGRTTVNCVDTACTDYSISASGINTAGVAGAAGHAVASTSSGMTSCNGSPTYINNVCGGTSTHP